MRAVTFALTLDPGAPLAADPPASVGAEGGIVAAPSWVLAALTSVLVAGALFFLFRSVRRTRRRP
ncbi:MAG: hypothetical protein AAGH15_27955 [Myxococcota bacterium]